MNIVRGREKHTDAHFVPVSTQEDLDRLLTASTEQPVVLFKHDYACPTSVRAYWDLVTVPGEVSLIDVEQHHALSQEAAARLGVRHESPQVIVVRDGKPIYAASHRHISPEAVTRSAGRDEMSGAHQPEATTE